MDSAYCNPTMLRYLLYEVHRLDEVLAWDRFTDYDREAIDLMIDSFKDFADRELYPFFREMDENPCHYEQGTIRVHPQVGVIIQQCAEMGFIGSGFDYDQGGMQLPTVVHYALQHMLDAANNHVMGYPTLTTGAANLILTFGSDALSQTYVPQMLAGKWMGTMALTEPQAGSSLSDLTTEAVPREDGTYAIRGQKIFISGGDHEYAENFVHLLLARIQGAPAGTKGISLFVVPKLRPDANGTLQPNDVITAGEFKKMGQRGYATTHLIFGEKEDCRGWLVGAPHQGLKYMFQMMNEARISVGVTATSMATAAYYASKHYAGDRKQGRPILSKGKKDVSQEPIPIREHPDVRRMLMRQKAITEGCLSLTLECSRLADAAHAGPEEQREDANLLLELLTPVAKTYPAEMGQASINEGLQVLGGYGYTTDYLLEQYYRDIRITSIYEGTTGIQSLDLLGRKIPMAEGRTLQILSQEMQKIIDRAKSLPSVQRYAEHLEAGLGTLWEVLQHLQSWAQQGDFQRYLADATIFMKFFSTLVVGWQWLKMAVIAAEKLQDSAQDYPAKLLQEIIESLKFYYKYEWPGIQAYQVTLMHPEALTVD